MSSASTRGPSCSRQDMFIGKAQLVPGEDELRLTQQSPFKGWISGNVMTPRWLPSTCLPISYNFLVYSGLPIGFLHCQSCLFSCTHSSIHPRSLIGVPTVLKQYSSHFLKESFLCPFRQALELLQALVFLPIKIGSRQDLNKPWIHYLGVEINVYWSKGRNGHDILQFFVGNLL